MLEASLKYKITNVQGNSATIGVTLHPKSRLASVSVDSNPPIETELSTQLWQFNQNGSLPWGEQFSISVGTPLEDIGLVALPLFYLIRTSVFGIPIPSLHPHVISHRTNSKRTIELVNPPQNPLQKMCATLTMLSVAYYR